MHPVKKYYLSLAYIGLLLFIVACGDKDENNPHSIIPNVPVNFYIYPNTIDFIEVQNYREYNNYGYRGVIVFRLDQTTFMAYEKTCPYDANLESGRVYVDMSTFSMIDSTCQSSYNLLDGMPNGGPSSTPLLQYGTFYDGNQLHIFNNF
jgi:hypothetical protein